jgi:hypothetical protein
VILDKRPTWSKHRSGENERGRDWEHWGLSWTEAVFPSGMVFCYISSSSVPWRTMRVLFGGPPLVPVSINCRYCSPNVFASLLMHPGTL